MYSIVLHLKNTIDLNSNWQRFILVIYWSCHRCVATKITVFSSDESRFCVPRTREEFRTFVKSSIISMNLIYSAKSYMFSNIFFLCHCLTCIYIHPLHFLSTFCHFERPNLYIIEDSVIPSERLLSKEPLGETNFALSRLHGHTTLTYTFFIIFQFLFSYMYKTLQWNSLLDSSYL